MKKRILFAVFLLSAIPAFAQEKTSEPKEKNLEEVVLQKKKKAVEQKADRTIFDISEQPQLNTGNLLDGVKKLPGLIVSDVAGMMYQGKQLAVFMDGRPLNITSNELNSFLEGMPANAVERIEIITQPGAEFPATSGGAILNIITSKAAKNYLTATYSGNYSFTNEDKWRSKTSNSLNLNARNSLFGWQLNFGQNYRESKMNSFFDTLSETFAERINRSYFVKAATTFDFGKDRLILSYDLNKSHNSGNIFSTETVLNLINKRNDATISPSIRHEVAANFQKRFKDPGTTLDIKLAYNNSDGEFQQNNLPVGNKVLDNNSQGNTITAQADYSQQIKLFDKGKITAGLYYENLKFITKSFNTENLNYKRTSVSTYLEGQTSYKKLDFILGLRGENYDIGGEALNFNNGVAQIVKLKDFKQFRLFPNATAKYNLGKMVYFSLNYNKKITLPSISLLNPNNQVFSNSSIATGGNPNLEPTIFNNFEAKISAFDYAYLGYNLSSANNQVSQITFRDNGIIKNINRNIDQIRIHNVNIGIPIPFMIFKTGIKEAMKFNFNPDKINFMYLYLGYQKHELPDMKTKGFWIINIMNQFMLPYDTKLVANFSYLTSGGNYFYYVADKPFSNSLDLTLTKKFMNDGLTVNIFANDILNGSKMAIRSTYNNSNVFLGNDWDSRSFGLSVNYKIPTKNKLAKEDPNLLNRSTKEEAGGGLTPTP